MKQTEIIKSDEPTFNIEALIAQGIEKGLSVETMERLLAMRTQLKDEYAKEEFLRALSAFQGECPIIEKRKKVAFGTTKYNYAPLEDIVEQVKDLLIKYGFSYSFDTKTNGKMQVICKVSHIAGHVETATFDMEIDTNAKMNVSQKYGSALTYAKRYAFCAAFGITVRDEDLDTVGTSPNAPRTISEDYISMIDHCDTLEALIKASQGIKKKIEPELQKSLNHEYTRRKKEIEATKIDPIADDVDKALNPPFNNK